MYLQPINNVLIIGSQGFLGNRLIQHLNLHDKLQIFTDRTLVPGFDLHNSNHRERVLRLCNPQVVIQTAWCTRMNYLESPENACYRDWEKSQHLNKNNFRVPGTSPGKLLLVPG